MSFDPRDVHKLYPIMCVGDIKNILRPQNVFKIITFGNILDALFDLAAHSRILFLMIKLKGRTG